MWRQSFFKAETDSRQILTSKKMVNFHTATICTLAKKATATTAVSKYATKGLKSKPLNDQSPLERPLRTPLGISSLCCLPKKDEGIFQFVVQYPQKPIKIYWLILLHWNREESCVSCYKLIFLLSKTRKTDLLFQNRLLFVCESQVPIRWENPILKISTPLQPYF